MKINELIKLNRSYRRFDNSKKLDKSFIAKLIEAARLSQSAANLQPIRYIPVLDKTKTDEVFSTLSWATYLKNWAGPNDTEKPVGYIVVLTSKNSMYALVDAGLAMQNICLSAIEQGVGSCIIANIKRDELSDILEIDSEYTILYVIALGVPAEKIKLIDAEKNHNHKYFRDEKGNHCVPKRSSEEIILKEFF